MDGNSIHTVYVLNKDGKPLMPTRPAKTKWLLKQGKAEVVRKSPFAIRLKYQIENPILQPAELVIDDGETVGVAVVQHNKTHQRVVFCAKMRLRGREVKDLLEKRRRLRKERKKRCWQRKIKIKKHRNIPESIKADVEAKVRLVEKILKIVPIATILWEALTFSLSKKKKRRYKQGLASGLDFDERRKEAVLKRDSYRCCICKRQIEEKRAFIYRIIGRTNREGNLISICPHCFAKVSDNHLILSLNALNCVDMRGSARCMEGKAFFGIKLKAMGIPIMLVNGWRTQQCRDKLGLTKNHINDAIAIGCRGQECKLMESYFLVRLRARHQRKLFFENPGDKDIQKVLSRLVKASDNEYNKRFRSLRRSVRRRLYVKRYGRGGVLAKEKLLGFKSDPFVPNEAIYVKKDGTRGIIKNYKIYKDQELPKAKEILKIFRRGDLVKTEEGKLAEVISLFSSGKVSIKFFSGKKEKTARIPEKLFLFERGKPMQFIRIKDEKRS